MAKKEKTIEVAGRTVIAKSFNMKTLRVLSKRFGHLYDAAEEDPGLRAALNLILNVINGDSTSLNPGTIAVLMPKIIGYVIDELFITVSELTDFTIEEIEDMEPEDFIAIVWAFIEVNDKDKIVNLLKNSLGRPGQEKSGKKPTASKQ